MAATILEEEIAIQPIKNIIMKKGKPFNLTVKRISTSPYYSSSFVELEKNTLESIEGVKCLGFNSFEDSDILITNTHTQMSDIATSQLAKCKLLLHPNSGYDNFNYTFVKEAYFPIIIGNSIRSHAVANYILSGLLNHYSSIPLNKSWDASRRWKRKLLCEINLQIIGDGHISKILQKSLSPLVKNIFIYDPYKNKKQLELRDIDVLIPVCSLNESSKHIVNYKMLEKLNSDFLLINAARGELVDTNALTQVLARQPHAFALLDVFEKEPFDFSLFKNINNIHLSSHIAGVYSNLDHATCEFEKMVLKDFCQLSQNEFDIKYTDSLLKNRIFQNSLI
jgi:D-3-phosphoglycerate dehydrogenase